ncbi:MAG: peptide ABC transporter substrate-binding protein [Candidatus Cybelea sp.]
MRMVTTGRLAAFSALVLCIAGCARVGAGHGWGTAHQMTIVRANDPPSLNPLFEFLQTDIDLTQLYAEPLVGLSSQNRLIPVVASRVPSVGNGDISRDLRTVTYHLRRNERFADGVPLTAKDVAFTYRAIINPRNPVAEVQPYRTIERLDTPDPYTVVLHLRRPWAAAVSSLFAVTDFIIGILPAHAFTSTDLTHAAWNEHPFGTGPFRVVQWRRGDEIIFEPNSYARRKPHLRRLVLKIVPDRNTERLLLLTHAADVVDSLTDQQVIQSRSAPGFRLVRTEENVVTYVAFQTFRPPTDDLRVRRALLDAIDTAAIAHKVAYGLWPRASTEIAPVLWAHDASIRLPIYDPRRAATELDAAGWKMQNGRRVKAGIPFEIQMSYYGWSEESRSAATLIQEYLANIGARVTLRAYPSDLYFSVPNGVYYSGRFNLAWGGYYGGSDPEQSEFFTCDRVAPNGPNVMRWCDRSYDALFNRQSRTADQTRRQAAFNGMQRKVADGILFVPLFYHGGYTGTNPAVRGWDPNMLFEFSNSEDWDVQPE